MAQIIENHEPDPEQELSTLSLSVYLRQDPFKETIYIYRYNVLFMLA